MDSGEEMVFTVDSQGAGERLDAYISRRTDGVSRSILQKIISSGKVTVNGRVASKNRRLSNGERVVVGAVLAVRPEDTAPEPQDIPIDILFEDRYLIAVNKPPGLVIHPGNGNPDKTLVNALLYRFGALSGGTDIWRPGIVHRLDKNTSGVVLVARTDEAHRELSKLFHERKIEKRYAGFCIGNPSQQQGIIDLPLARSRKEPVKRSVDRKGKPALTEYSLIKAINGISFLTFKLHTGRTHQIRVHCSQSGFPILGDTLYGGGREKILKIPPLERPFAFSVFKCFTRQALHSRSLEFIHPISLQNVSIIAPWPDDFVKAMNIMGVQG